MDKVERLQQTTVELQTRLDVTASTTAAKDELMLKSLQQLTSKLQVLEESRELTTTTTRSSDVAVPKDPSLCHYIDRGLGIACGNPRTSTSHFCSLHGGTETLVRCRHRHRRRGRCENMATPGLEYCSKHKAGSVRLDTKTCRAMTHRGQQCVQKAVDGGILCKNHLQAQNAGKKRKQK